MPPPGAGTRALLTQAYKERAEERAKRRETTRPVQAVAAARVRHGPSWSSSDDTPPQGMGSDQEEDEEEHSSSGNE